MKNKFSISPNRLRLSLLCGLLFAIFASFAHFNVACDDLRTNVLRLHIIANSDSESDQALKLKIRDSILKNSGEMFYETENVEEAVAVASKSLDRIEAIANKVIAESGFDYTAKAQICDGYFETREYDDFTLPAGVYKSLTVTVGEGDGKNWWCVIFPEVCLPAASDASLTDSVTAETAHFAEGAQRYQMRFWAVEMYEDIKNFFQK